MSINKFARHVYVLPEDRANVQIANGFVEHDRVNDRSIQIMPSAEGWLNVLRTLEEEYVGYLRRYPLGYVVLLVDFDGSYEGRRRQFEEAVPEDLRGRVFVLGAAVTPEALRNELKMSWGAIGNSLAEDCHDETVEWWTRGGLAHNEPDRRRLYELVRPFLIRA